MSDKERIELLEEIMDLDSGTLKAEDKLADYEEWDSLSILSFISEMDSKFGKKVSGDQVKALVTVADAISMME